MPESQITAYVYPVAEERFVKTCPYCRMRISPKAVRCPFCQTDFTAEEVAEGKRENRRRTEQYILIIIAAAVAGIWWLSQPGNVESLAEGAARHDTEGDQK